MAKSMSLLLGDGSPPCQQVMIALEEKKLQGYKHKVLSFEKGEHTFQEVLEINPRGHLPAFKHGDNIVNESSAACLYLEPGVDFDQLQENLCQMERRCKASWDHLKVIAKHEMKPQLKQKMSDFLKDCICWLLVGRYPKLARYYSLLKDRPSIKSAGRHTHCPAHRIMMS
ncbi:glutathione S-transferase A-like [Scomber japonicus]|uniref:glutathione S-transferase A-like n=1 Tax=Scomber japonicus TaxID=13676 RepID=UPI002305A8A7|nr:glutathione S-transferase A-like [Scomber japonicus]